MKSIKILSIDGGGIRGIIPAIILGELQKRLGRNLCEVFDLIAGTSTGGIIAVGIGTTGNKGKPYTPDELLKLYVENGPAIFKKSWFTWLKEIFRPKYSPRALEGVLAQYFGNIQLNTALTPLLVASYDLNGQQPFFFKSHVIAAYPNWNWPVVHVARATSAAPTFFPPLRLQEGIQGGKAEETDRDSSATVRPRNDSVETGRDPSPASRDQDDRRGADRKDNVGTERDSPIAGPIRIGPSESVNRTSITVRPQNDKRGADQNEKGNPGGGGRTYALVDGGVYVNNPAMAAYAEARRIYPEFSEFVMVAVGTGDRQDHIAYAKARRWGLLGWAKQIVPVFMDSVSESVDYQLKYMPGCVFHRLQVSPLNATENEMDNVTPQNLDNLQKTARDYVAAHADELDAICNELREGRGSNMPGTGRKERGIGSNE